MCRLPEIQISILRNSLLENKYKEQKLCSINSDIAFMIPPKYLIQLQQDSLQNATSVNRQQNAPGTANGQPPKASYNGYGLHQASSYPAYKRKC